MASEWPQDSLWPLTYGHRSLHRPHTRPFFANSLRNCFFPPAGFESVSQRSDQCDRNKEMRQFLRAGFVGQELDDDQCACFNYLYFVKLYFSRSTAFVSSS